MTYCHLRPPDAMPVLTLKCFGAPRHQWSHFDGCIYTHYVAPRYSAHISSIYLLLVGKVWLGSVCWFPCATPGNEARRTQNLRSVDKNSGPILSRLWTKVCEILGQCRRPLALCNDLAGLSMACFIQKTYAIKSRSRRKIEQTWKLFGSHVVWEGRPRLF